MATTIKSTDYLIADNTWHYWNTTATTTNIVYEDPWRTWTTMTSSTGTVYPVQQRTWTRWQEPTYTFDRIVPVETPEQVQARLDRAQRQREEASARALARQQRMLGAEDRAWELFRSLLTEEQIRTMDETHEVWVKGSDGGLYVIETWNGRVHGNIRAVDEHGCMLGRLCVQPQMYDYAEAAALPASDGHVGQLLAIRFNEKRLRETANWSGVRACQQPEVPILRAA